MKFRISPSGMYQTGRKTTDHHQDLEANVRRLLGALERASHTCGGPIAHELARLAGDVTEKTHVMSSRVGRMVAGAGEVTHAHVEGDHDMARHARQAQAGTASADKDVPGEGGR